MASRATKPASARKLARRAVVGVAAIAAVALLAVTAGREGSHATDHGLRLDQPGSPAGRGVPLHLARVAARVHRLRGLAFMSPPRVRVISAAELGAMGRRLNRGVIRHMNEQPRRLERIRKLKRARAGFQRLAGILPEEPASDVGARGPAERIGGAYDYRHKRIVLVQGATQTRRELELLLAHELDHVLEDQHFRLRLWTSVDATERAQARRALIEGTAMFVAARYARRYLGDQVSVKQRVAGQGSVYAAASSTPYAIRAATIFDYVDGALFVRGLHLHADGWSTVNAALRRPPTRSQEILHPRGWRRRPAPATVHLGIGPLLSVEWHLVGGGPAGEQDALAILGRGAPEAEVEPGADGWTGGRFQLWRARSESGCEGCAAGEVGVVAFRWRGRHDAWEFGRAFNGYMLLGRLAERAGPRTWELGEGFASLRSTRLASAIAFAPSEELATSAARQASLHAAGR
jgi:hypothetical protein